MKNDYNTPCSELMDHEELEKIFEEDCAGKKTCQIHFNRQKGRKSFDHAAGLDYNSSHSNKVELDHLNKKIFPPPDLNPL